MCVVPSSFFRINSVLSSLNVVLILLAGFEWLMNSGVLFILMINLILFDGCRVESFSVLLRGSL